MTEPSRERVVVTDSGGTMTRMSGQNRSLTPDLSCLESHRSVTIPGPLRPAGEPPYFEAGDVVTWHYGVSLDVLRVVRDDSRGLVAWLPAGSERIAAFPRDGRGIRERSLEERARLAVGADYDLRVSPWRGPGLLRIVDLWLEAGELWLKDADALEAGLAVGKYTPQQAAAIRDIAEQARHDLVEPNAWPLDEGWEDWQPPAEWDVPLTLPDDVVEISSDRST